MLSCIVPSHLIARSSKEFLLSARYLHRRKTTFSDITLNLLPGVRCLHRRIGRTSGLFCNRTFPLSGRETTENTLTRSLGRIYGRLSTEWTRVASTQRRCLHSSPASQHGGITRPQPGTGIKVHFKDSDGNLIKTIEANEGDDILAIAHEYDIDLEGACEGSVACSTCHVILPPEYYDLLPEPEDDENDMLDMAFGLTDTSRLGCQVKLTKELDGLTCTLPSATRNMFVDGHKPTHH